MLQAVLNFKVEHLLKLSQIIRLIYQNMHPIHGFNGVGSTTKIRKQNNYAGGLAQKMGLGIHYAPIPSFIQEDSDHFPLLLVFIILSLHKNK